MDIDEMRKRAQLPKQDQKEEWYIGLLRFFSIYITRYVLRTTITANQVTLARVCCGLAGGVCFCFGSGLPSLAGALLLLVSYLLDCVDGEVARLRGSSSLTGATIDYFSHSIIYTAAITGISLGAWRESGVPFLIWGVGGAMLYLLTMQVRLMCYRICVDTMLKGAYPPKIFEASPETSVDPGSPIQRRTTAAFARTAASVFFAFLHTANQKLLFLALSLLDVMCTGPTILGKETSFIGAYLAVFSAICTAAFFYVIYDTMSALRADKLYEALLLVPKPQQHQGGK